MYILTALFHEIPENLDNFSEHNFQNLSMNVVAPTLPLNGENIQKWQRDKCLCCRTF